MLITLISIAYDELIWEASYGTGIKMILHTVFPMFVDFYIYFWGALEFYVHCSVAKPLAIVDPQTTTNITSNWIDVTKKPTYLGNFFPCCSLIFFQPDNRHLSLRPTHAGLPEIFELKVNYCFMIALNIQYPFTLRKDFALKYFQRSLGP